MALTDISQMTSLAENAVRHHVTEQSVLVSPFDVTAEEATGNLCLPGKSQFCLQLRTASSYTGKVCVHN